MAGIGWGIASIVLIVAMGDGFKAGQKNSMKSLGEDIVILFGGRTELQAGGERAGRRVRLNYSDVTNMRRECYLASIVAAELRTRSRRRALSIAARLMLAGWSHLSRAA